MAVQILTQHNECDVNLQVRYERNANVTLEIRKDKSDLNIRSQNLTFVR